MIASALSEFLPDIFLDVKTWMSDHDLQPGLRWSSALSTQLDESRFGVICLTPENLSAPWLLYEAGALAKGVTESRVVLYLFSLNTADVAYPLAQFQGVNADKDGTRRLLTSINSVRQQPIEEERLERVFTGLWPNMAQCLQEIPSKVAEKPRRSEREIIEEVLNHVREITNPGAAYSPSHVPRSAVWKTQHDITARDLENMTDEEIDLYIDKAHLRAVYASGDEDTALSKRIDKAIAERVRRQSGAKQLHAPEPAN